jgi:hypothetical protein
MRPLLINVVVVASCLIATPLFAEDIIQDNDIIAVTGSVEPCDDFGRFVAWRTRVTDGVIEIDGQTITASGLSTRKLQESLELIMGPNLGTRLSAIQIEIISPEHHSESRTNSCEMISEAIKACEKRVRRFEEKEGSLAAVSYNKSFKFVPPASWLHRTRAAHAPLN